MWKERDATLPLPLELTSGLVCPRVDQREYPYPKSQCTSPPGMKALRDPQSHVIQDGGGQGVPLGSP